MHCVSFIHIVEVFSRSGRVSAELGRMDIDSIADTETLISNLVDKAYSRIFNPEKHNEIKIAILGILENIELIPGNDAEAITTLKDGRTIKIRRIIT